MRFLAFLAILSIVIASSDVTPSVLDLPLNQWPIVSSHDAATGYLQPSDFISDIVYAWTKTQVGNLSTQLTCGSRGFDIRPYSNGTSLDSLLFHHGPVVVPYRMTDALKEIVVWMAAHVNASHPEETMARLNIWDCEGNTNCWTNVRSALKAATIPVVSCTDLLNMTVRDALAVSKLPGGGHLFAAVNCDAPNTYNDTLECFGFRSSAEDYAFRNLVTTCTDLKFNTAEWVACVEALEKIVNVTSQYSCVDNATKGYAFDQLLMWNKKFGNSKPPALPNASYIVLQGAWAGEEDDVILGFLNNSSLIDSEIKSGLNRVFTKWVKDGEFTYTYSVGVNHVCDGGNALLEALRSRVRKGKK